MINEILKYVKSLACGEEKLRKLVLNADELKKMQALLKAHKLNHFLADIIEQNDLINLDAEIYLAAKQTKKKTIFKSILQQEATDNAISALEESKVKHILLKGARIKELYSQPWMRTGEDIDILIPVDDIKRAEEALLKNGFSFFARSTHDVSFSDKNSVRVELHYSLIEEDWANDASIVLENVWEYAKKDPNYEFQFLLLDEMMYFYHIAHLAKHFELGGCGIRAILDTYLLNVLSFNGQKREELLKKGNLLTFAKKIEQLSMSWFCLDKPLADSVLSDMSEYILRGGSFGTLENQAKIRAKESKVKAIFKMLFPKKSDMERLFPVVKRSALVLPICWVVRWVRIIVSGRGGKSIAKIRAINAQNDDAKQKMSEFLSNIGL